MTDARYMRPGLEFAREKTVEEAGELMEALSRMVTALGKTGRWGWDSVNPELPKEQQETNEEWVQREMTDVISAIENLNSELIRRARLDPISGGAR